MDTNGTPGVEILHAKNVVQANLRMYWGTNSPNSKIVNAAITRQLQQEGCVHISIDEMDGWQMVSCEESWAATVVKKVGRVEAAFHDAVAFCEGGRNALRFEYFLFLLATDLQVVVNKQIIVSKGGMDEQLKQAIREKCVNRVCVCYRL